MEHKLRVLGRFLLTISCKFLYYESHSAMLLEHGCGLSLVNREPDRSNREPDLHWIRLMLKNSPRENRKKSLNWEKNRWIGRIERSGGSGLFFFLSYFQYDIFFIEKNSKEEKKKMKLRSTSFPWQLVFFKQAHKLCFVWTSDKIDNLFLLGIGMWIYKYMVLPHTYIRFKFN
jgi:hypothetical protein